MKSRVILFLCCYMAIAADDAKTIDYSRLNDLQREGLKGNVRSEETREGNKATFANGKWVAVDTGIATTLLTYDRKGNLATTAEMLRAVVTIQSGYWKDEDGLYNALLTDSDNPGKTELLIREFADDTALVIKTYNTDEDTITYDQLEEEVKTYTGFGFRRECFAVKNGSKRRYLYYEKHNLAADTFSINYYGESSARLTHAVLERDAIGNPTKILVCTDVDTTLTVKKYSYY